MSDPARAPGAGWSLERRLRHNLLASLVALWLAGSAAALLGLRHEASEVLDSVLVETAQRLLALPQAALGGNLGGSPPAAGLHEEYVLYQLAGRDGHLRLRSHSAPAQPMDPGAPDGIRETQGRRVLTLTATDGDLRVQVAETDEHRREILWAGAAWLGGALGAVVVVAALVLRRLLHGAFRALEPARADLAARAAGDLRPVPAAGAPDELQPWLETVNALLARVGSLVEAERAFAAHTAHELRTPLAAARARAQRLTSDAPDDATRAHALALVRQLDRLTRLATRLLQLARIESGVALKREPVDLTLLARLVADEFIDARGAGRLVVEIHGEPAPVAGDLDALGIALRNLIDNALKHAAGAARVTVRVGPGEIAVIDDGPGVPPASLGTLVRPFVRGEVASEGSGLGLAIVNTIALQSGARLELRSPVDHGHGFGATLRFDLAAGAGAAAAPPDGCLRAGGGEP